MKKLLKIAAFLAIGLFAGIASAQTSSATETITVTAAAVPAAISVTQSATTVPAGGTISFGVAAAGPAGGATPTGSVELLASAPGSTAKTLVNTFTLTGGAFTCSYPIPAAAAPGAYTIEFAYGGDANYSKSPDFQ